MLTVIIDQDNGVVFPENKIAEKISELALKGETFSIGGNVEFVYFCFMVKSGLIKDCSIIFNGEVIPFENNGRLKYWPKGMFDNHADWLSEIVFGEDTI